MKRIFHLKAGQDGSDWNEEAGYLDQLKLFDIDGKYKKNWKVMVTVEEEV